MKNKKTLDNVLAAVVILVAAACAVGAFFLESVAGWGAGCWVAAYALMTWLCKRVQDSYEKVVKEKNDLNELYKGATEEKMLYREEKQKLVAKVSQLEKDVQERDRRIQELSDQLQIESMKDSVEVTAKAEQEKPATQEGKDLNDIKATLLKVKKRSKKKE